MALYLERDSAPSAGPGRRGPRRVCCTHRPSSSGCSGAPSGRQTTVRRPTTAIQPDVTRPGNLKVALRPKPMASLGSSGRRRSRATAPHPARSPAGDEPPARLLRPPPHRPLADVAARLQAARRRCVDRTTGYPSSDVTQPGDLKVASTSESRAPHPNASSAVGRPPPRNFLYESLTFSATPRYTHDWLSMCQL